jgi:ArsR family transcriptional regulator
MTKLLERPPGLARTNDRARTDDALPTLPLAPSPQALNPAIRNMPKLTNDAILSLVEICKLLADETRMRILFALTQQPEIHVRALCDMLGQSQPAVSHHLGLLRSAGLIDLRREGKHNYYHALTDRVHELLDVVFAGVPEPNRRIRFDDYVLSFAPPT